MLTLKSNLFKNKRGQQALVANLQKLAKALIVDDFANVSGKDSSHGFTYSLAKLIIKKITSDKDAKILILNDITLEMFYALLEAGYKRENIYIAFGKWNKDATVRDDNRLFNIMKNYIRANFEEEINIIELKEIFNMKVDLVIANPPYNKNLHLKILKVLADRFYESGTEIVSLQPIRWLQDSVSYLKSSSDYNTFKASIVDRISNLDCYSCVEASEQFNIATPVDLGIYTLNKYKQQLSILPGINLSDVERNILNKVLNYSINNNIDMHIEQNKIDGFRVKCVTILHGCPRSQIRKDRANIYYSTDCVLTDGYSDAGVFFADITHQSKGKNTLPNSIKFNSKEEAENYLNSLKTNFMKNLVLLTTWDVHVPCKILPFMPSYLNKWTDKTFCEFFNLTDDETRYMSADIVEGDNNEAIAGNEE